MGDHDLKTVLVTVRENPGRTQTSHYPCRVTVITATTPISNQVVVTPLPEFRLGQNEPLPVGLKRLTLREFEKAVDGFYNGEDAFADAVHEARKATKRVRSVLHLIRPEIGEKVFRFETDLLRQSSGMLSSVRDSVAILESFDVLDRIYGHLLVDGALSETRYRLEHQRDRIQTRVMEDPDIVMNVVENFERAHSRYSNWSVDPDSHAIYGRGIRDEFDAIGPGFRRTYEKGRKRMVRAYVSMESERFHQWRKSVKYLRHQLELMTPLWPEVVVGMAITMARVGELLGQDHDLAVLLERLETDVNLCPDPVQRSLIRALANQRRSDLRTAARILGRRVFAEEPDSLASRLDVYWESREPGVLEALEAVNI